MVSPTKAAIERAKALVENKPKGKRKKSQLL